MAGAPEVSFVLPCYNLGRYLPDCLNSIFAQKDLPSFEVIAVDDGSTDNTAEVLQSFSRPELIAVHQPANRGHAATVEEGLRRARGKYVARIDPDDRYRPHFLKQALPKLRSTPEVVLVYGDAAIINEQGQVTDERSDRLHGGRDFKGNEYVRLLERNFICSPTVIARRESWLKALPVPANLVFHDWYFTLSMAREGEFYFIANVLAEYRVHPGNLHAAIARDRREEESVFWLLDRLFSSPERDAGLEARKQRAKRRIYAAHFLDFANKYFGFRIDAEARRCYLRALAGRPEWALRPDVVRRLAGTLIGRNRYEAIKNTVLSRRPAP